jgi:chemosensory pili system protein ChpA (sensor histidine kinase/response regulator)
LLRGVKTLLGAYVLPDGRVAPVVNLPQLLADLRPVAMLTAPKDERKSGELRALVVDDSMSMRVALSGTLQNAGFSVLTARDGQEALEVLKREGLPSLVTLDVEMPRMDGLETLFAIRQLAGAEELPVFMMTSRGGTKHRRAAEQLGATRYFTKPYRDSELATAARAVCTDARAP